MTPREAPAKKATKKSMKKATTTATTKAMKADGSNAGDGFSDFERDAMRERAEELKAARRARARGASDADAEAEVLEKIAGMATTDRAMAERLHAIVRAAAPALVPRLWYGMPAYAKDGKVLCFFQGAQKFKTRYSTLGFSDVAALDDGPMWPSGFALAELTAEVEARIAALVRQAVAE